MTCVQLVADLLQVLLVEEVRLALVIDVEAAVRGAALEWSTQFFICLYDYWKSMNVLVKTRMALAWHWQLKQWTAHGLEASHDVTQSAKRRKRTSVRGPGARVSSRGRCACTRSSWRPPRWWAARAGARGSRARDNACECDKSRHDFTRICFDRKRLKSLDLSARRHGATSGRTWSCSREGTAGAAAPEWARSAHARSSQRAAARNKSSEWSGRAAPAGKSPLPASHRVELKPMFCVVCVCVYVCMCESMSYFQNFIKEIFSKKIPAALYSYFLKIKLFNLLNYLVNFDMKY